MSTSTAVTGKTQKRTMSEILHSAGRRALGGGLPGAIAMGAQVTTLIGVRCVANYQFRHGGSTIEVAKKLYKEGGVRRFYRGYAAAMFQGPLARFGDTAANAGVLALLEDMEQTKDLHVSIKTGAASVAAGLWRICITPIDTIKTTLQVEGTHGLPLLAKKVARGGPLVMFHGALGASAATMVGFYPWFLTYNYLNERLPEADTAFGKLTRSAGMGFSASVISDTCSNSIRVLKTTRQTSADHTKSYLQHGRDIIAKDGVIGLMGRGLRTRILANGLQGSLFAVCWRYLQSTLFADMK